MNALIDNTALKHLGQVMALHWGTLLLEFGVLAVFFILPVSPVAQGFDQSDILPTVTYIVWSLRIVQVIAQVMTVVLLSRLIDAGEEFAHARLIYVVLMIFVAITLMMEGLAAGGDIAKLLEDAAADRMLSFALMVYAALELVAKPVLLALGSRIILFGCARLLDSFGLYGDARACRRTGVAFSASSASLALLGVTAALVAMLEQRTGGFATAAAGRLLDNPGMVCLLAIGIFTVCALLFYGVSWAVSAWKVSRTYTLLEELAS